MLTGLAGVVSRNGFSKAIPEPRERQFHPYAADAGCDSFAAKARRWPARKESTNIVPGHGEECGWQAERDAREIAKFPGVIS